METAVVFREGHRRLRGKMMGTIFHSIKLLHLAQLATHTKVKERDLFMAARSGTCAQEGGQIEAGAPPYLPGCSSGYQPAEMIVAQISSAAKCSHECKKKNKKNKRKVQQDMSASSMECPTNAVHRTAAR